MTPSLHFSFLISHLANNGEISNAKHFLSLKTVNCKLKTGATEGSGL